MSGPTPHGNRAVVTEEGSAISLSIYGMQSAAVLAVVSLEPLTALRVAHELIGAAARHLSREQP